MLNTTAAKMPISTLLLWPDYFSSNKNLDVFDSTSDSDLQFGQCIHPFFEIFWGSLEPHRKNLILNASAPCLFDTQASNPTEFYTAFLSKAKEMTSQKFHLNKVAFNPSSSFIANLWNSDFFWILPDCPSGVSIFFCPVTKSLNASELEKKRNFAMADKVKAVEIEKLTKQKLFLPNNIMDMVCMTWNLYSILSLCFGKTPHSAIFLKDWADHMYENHLI